MVLFAYYVSVRAATCIFRAHLLRYLLSLLLLLLFIKTKMLLIFRCCCCCCFCCCCCCNRDNISTHTNCNWMQFLFDSGCFEFSNFGYICRLHMQLYPPPPLSYLFTLCHYKNISDSNSPPSNGFSSLFCGTFNRNLYSSIFCFMFYVFYFVLCFMFVTLNTFLK